MHGLEQDDARISSFLFVVIRLLHDAVKELAAHHLLRHKVVIFVFVKDIVEPDDVGMLHLLKNRNFIFKSYFIFLRELGFRHNLDCKGVAIDFVGAFLDDRKSTRAEL
jgi:hypothetical protein